MRRPPVRPALARVLAAAPLAAAGVLVAAAPAAASTRETVHLRGTAYEFNRVDAMLGGATIRVAERPKLRATVRADGTYDLAVPAHARITPYIEASGYHTIYLQTFRTRGADLRDVNFQTPTEDVYRALAALLRVPLDGAGQARRCAIVSTFSTRDVRGVSFARFVAYGAHGVAGATATGRPRLPSPVYFNAAVIPDPSQRRSSKDGGVVWTGVPSGVYRIRARHPGRRFAGFTATCRPGRVINANPPWGLHELAPASPARVSARFSRRGAHVTLRSLRARRLPAHAVLRLSCSGRRCPFASRTLRPRRARAELRLALGHRATRLRAGQTLSLRISARAHNALVVRWRLPTSGPPRRTQSCIALGDTRPRPRCPAA